MNKFAIYIILLLVYLGLAKSFSPSEQGMLYIPSAAVFPHYFKDAPVEVILTNMHRTGFIIHTYYHKYRLIYAFRPSEEIIVKTSRDFWKKNSGHIGLSLFSRTDRGDKVSLVALIPGNAFLGDLGYGNWSELESGEKVWEFHRPYRHLYNLLGWGEFRPNIELFRKIEQFKQEQIPLLGGPELFGPKGSLTAKFYPDYVSSINKQRPKFKEFLADYFAHSFKMEHRK